MWYFNLQQAQSAGEDQDRRTGRGIMVCWRLGGCDVFTDLINLCNSHWKRMVNMSAMGSPVSTVEIQLKIGLWIFNLCPIKFVYFANTSTTLRHFCTILANNLVISELLDNFVHHFGFRRGRRNNYNNRIYRP